MGSRLIMAALEKSIDHYWEELEICDYDPLLVELEQGGQITIVERQSLLLRLEQKKTGKVLCPGDGKP